MTLAQGSRLLAALFFLTVGAASAAPQASGQLVQQKLNMLEKMIEAVPVERPDASQEYRKHAVEARAHLEKGRAALAAGDEKTAETEINEAIRYVTLARKAGSAAIRAKEDQAQFKELVTSTESLLAAFKQNLERLPGGGAKRKDAEASLAEVGTMLDKARKLGKDDKIQAANALLLAAQRALQSGYTQMVGREVSHTQTFSSPAEEYRYELARNKGFQGLVPIALQDLKPSAEAKRTVEELVKYNQSAVATAESQYARKQIEDAIHSMRDGTQALERALQATGLVVPGQ